MNLHILRDVKLEEKFMGPFGSNEQMEKIRQNSEFPFFAYWDWFWFVLAWLHRRKDCLLSAEDEKFLLEASYYIDDSLDLLPRFTWTYGSLEERPCHFIDSYFYRDVYPEEKKKIEVTLPPPYRLPNEEKTGTWYYHGAPFQHAVFLVFHQGFYLPREEHKEGIVFSDSFDSEKPTSPTKWIILCLYLPSELEKGFLRREHSVLFPALPHEWRISEEHGVLLKDHIKGFYILDAASASSSDPIDE